MLFAATQAVAVLALLLCTFAAHADLRQALQQARESNLASDPQWRKLLHWPAQARAELEDSRFWLGSSPPSTAAAELGATLWALSQPGPYTDEHPLCRFPARRHFLESRLDWRASADPLDVCALYSEWYAMVRPARVTLVFPAYHLNSPSSMFGHTLLRLDPPDEPGWSDWLSFSVSFGADITSQDNSLLYAWKGLSGGYPGRFIVSPYFEKIQEYNAIENRDVWEYPLNLSAGETQRMVEHLWELKDIPFAYYFFDKNCSYRVLEMLEIARPGSDLVADFKWTAIPIDTVRAVDQAGFVDGQSYRPSRGTLLQARLSALPETLRAWVLPLALEPSTVQQEAFAQLAPQDRARLLDAAYEYLRFVHAKRQASPAIAQHSHALLRALNSTAKVSAPEPRMPAPPQQSHFSRQLSLRGGSRDGDGFAELGLRWSFHDLDDQDIGFLPGAQINIGSASLRWQQHRLQLQTLDLVDILSLSPRNRFFSPWSWGVRFGLERPAFDPEQNLDWQVSGGGGGSWQWGQHWQSFALVQARLDAPWHLDRDPQLGLGPDLGLIFRSQPMHLLLRATQRWESSGIVEQQWQMRATAHLSPQSSLRLSWVQAGEQGHTLPELWLGWQQFFP